VLTIIALVPVALLAVSSIILASDQVTRVVNKRVQTTAAVSSVVIGQETSNLVALVHSYATRPSLVAAMLTGTPGTARVRMSLASLQRAVPGISASFLADMQGNSRNTFPFFPSVIGTNFAYREWFKGLVASGRPYVSSAIETEEDSHTLAVTVTDYIRGPDGRPIGILGVNYSLQSIASFATNVGKAQGITLKVTDQIGTSLTAGGAHGLVSLATDPRVVAARAGRSGLLEYAPVLPGGRHAPEELSAYAPVPATGWTVIASVPRSAAFAGLVRLRETVLAITAVLVLILLAGVRIIFRLDRRRRDSELQVQVRDRELAQALAVSNAELEEFAAVASHDLREPLRKIKSFGNLLSTRFSAELPQEGAEYIERMSAAAVRMETLIDGVLDLSRAAKAESRFGHVSLDTVAAEVLADLQVQIAETGARIEVSDLPELEADALQMRQLLQNLIANALKFTRPNVTPVITVQGSLVHGVVELTVADNGIGFEERHAERIFGSFQRLHGRTEYPGTGLGLALCRCIAERHGGSIVARSTPGVGTRFVVDLPVAQPLADAA
jgi:signal transduction histidine kinase